MDLTPISAIDLLSWFLRQQYSCLSSSIVIHLLRSQPAIIIDVALALRRTWRADRSGRARGTALGSAPKATIFARWPALGYCFKGATPLSSAARPLARDTSARKGGISPPSRN